MALNSSQVIPELELESLTVTERKLEHPNRKKIVIGGGHKRQKSGHGGQHDTGLYNGGLMLRKTKTSLCHVLEENCANLSFLV